MYGLSDESWYTRDHYGTGVSFVLFVILDKIENMRYFGSTFPFDFCFLKASVFVWGKMVECKGKIYEG